MDNCLLMAYGPDLSYWPTRPSGPGTMWAKDEGKGREAKGIMLGNLLFFFLFKLLIKKEEEK